MTTASINSVVNLNVPATAPDGFKNPEVRAAVELFLNGLNNLLREFETYTGATQKDVTLWSSLKPTDTLIRHQAGRLYVIAGENLSVGDFINLYNDGGVLKVRKSNGTAGTIRPAHGYCSTSGGILTGNIGEVILAQGELAVTGLLPGQPIYLSTVAGLATVTPLTGVGQLEQFLGIGVATNLAYINIAMGQYIQH